MPPITILQSPTVFQSGGKPIRLDAYLPEAVDGPVPAVIALYGAGGGVSGMERYASMLAAQGFAVYLLHYFDRTGIESADKPPIVKQTIMRNFPLWMKTLWDATSFVETQPPVDRQRIALLGFSLGAYLSLANSAIDYRVKAVIEFFGGMPKEMNFFMRRLCPVLILHGEADPTIPVEEAYQLQRLLEKKGIPYEIRIYAGAGHGFEDEIVWRDAGLRSLQFLQKYLAAPEP
ncbi:MAG TPA: dienelactone hydrolase family protein [Terriglobales bacterium]|jgi:dienelactone hydrolase|nr:dienelactone hydrolase family protein [Terriglobales bacterium]